MLNEIKEKVEPLLSIAMQYGWEHTIKACEELISDIETDAYTFIVVGEFSAGKSSFINSLIGQSILPTGITPTTATINVLQHGDPSVVIHYVDGYTEEMQDVRVLKQLVASKMEDEQFIDLIDVFQPLPFLKERIVIIDTPGLNDVNKMRVDVTYQYIPHADVVFFLLDCRMPLRKSEFEFLKESLLAKGLERIIFIVNFADEVKEEELPFIVERIERELRDGLQLENIEIIPFSALEALEAKETNDDELLKLSGYVRMREAMDELCVSGTRLIEKKYRYGQRLLHIRNDVEESLQQRLLLVNQTKSELLNEVVKIEEWKDQQSVFLSDLRNYYEERVHEFKKMSSKSIATLFNKVEDELIEEVNLFQSSNFEQFFERRIPSLLRKRMKNWIEQYSPQLHVLIQKLELALSETLTDVLKEEVLIGPPGDEREGESLLLRDELEISITKKIDPLISSGLIVGSASALFMMLGGPIFLPVIGMVGLPYLQKKMVADQLDKIRPQVISDLEMKLITIRGNFEQEVHLYLDDNCEIVYENCIALFESRMQGQEDAVKQRLWEIQNDDKSQDDDSVAAKNQLAAIQNY